MARKRYPDPKSLKQRLRELVLSEAVGGWAALVKRGIVPEGTIKAWQDRDSPSVPDTASMLALAKKTGVNLNWLLLGEGPLLRESPAPTGEIAQHLRQHVVATVSASEGVPAADVGRILPSADALVRQVVLECRRDVADWRRLTSPLARRMTALARARTAAYHTREAAKLRSPAASVGPELLGFPRDRVTALVLQAEAERPRVGKSRARV